MSFILDALRKSESERQRQSGPALINAGNRPPAGRRSIWLPLLVVALLANVAVSGYFWLRRPAAAPLPPAAPVLPAPVPGDSSGSTLAAAAGMPTPADEAYAAIADLPALEEQPERATPAPAAASEPPADAPAPDGRTSAIIATLPTAARLMDDGVIPRRDLHLDIHVYSDAPEQRFVFINTRRYGEGADLGDGMRIEEITREGVVLSQAGQRFVLDRD